MKKTRTFLGQRIREARRQIRLNQETLAARAGVSKRAIQAIEEGKSANPQVETIRAIARVLKTSVDCLLGEAEPPHDKDKALLLALVDQLESRAIKILLTVARGLAADGDLPITTKDNEGFG